jgi:hypothetical protein
VGWSDQQNKWGPEQPPSGSVGVDFLDADSDPWRVKAKLAAGQHGRRDHARVVAAMVHDLLAVGPNDQLMP